MVASVSALAVLRCRSVAFVLTGPVRSVQSTVSTASVYDRTYSNTVRYIVSLVSRATTGSITPILPVAPLISVAAIKTVGAIGSRSAVNSINSIGAIGSSSASKPNSYVEFIKAAASIKTVGDISSRACVISSTSVTSNTAVGCIDSGVAVNIIRYMDPIGTIHSR